MRSLDAVVDPDSRDAHGSGEIGMVFVSVRLHDQIERECRERSVSVNDLITMALDALNAEKAQGVR